MDHAIDNEHRFTAAEDMAKSNKRRLDEVEKRQNDLEGLTSLVAELSFNQRHMEGDVKEIKADVKRLAAKPGKRWESMADKVVWAVLAAVIAFLLGRVGL